MSTVCGVILNTLVNFSVVLLYYVPYMFMFVLPLVRVMREAWYLTKLVQSATHTCRCPQEP